MRELSKNLILPSLLEKYIGVSNKKAKIKKLLIQRESNPWEVLLSWRNIPFDLSHVANVSNMIKDIANWPNSLFLPSDELSVLTTDYDGTFTEIHLCNELERYFKKSINLDDFQLSYFVFLKNYC